MWTPRERFGLGKKVTVLIVISLLALSGVGMGLAYRQLTLKDQIQTISNQVNVGLIVKVYHPGQVQPFATRSMPHDLILDNFNALIYDMLATGTPLTQVNIKSTGASSATPSAGFFGDTFSCTLTNFPATTCGGFIAIGTGINAPAVSDYNVQIIYPTSGTEYAPISGTITVSGSANPTTITGITGVQTISDNGISITEAGLFAMYGASGSVHAYMLFHDTFSAIGVNSGDQVTVSYTITFDNSGFTYNLSKIVAGWLINTSPSGTNTVALKNDGGSTFNFFTVCSTG